MKSNLSPEQIKKINSIPTETVEQFLARGGEIQVIGASVSKRSPTHKIDAQKLMDLAAGTANEQAVINFLISQGFDIQ